MPSEIDNLVADFNEAADRYNLARLEYALHLERAKLPPPARRMPADEADPQDGEQRPVTVAVQGAREFFEDVESGEVEADVGSHRFRALRMAAHELTKKFFRASLTRLGIPCSDIFDEPAA